MELTDTLQAASFIESFDRLISDKKLRTILKKHTSGRGAPAKISGSEVIKGLAYHFLSGAGALARARPSDLAPSV